MRKIDDLPKKYFLGCCEGQPLRFEAMPEGYGKELCQGSVKHEAVVNDNRLRTNFLNSINRIFNDLSC